MQKEIVKGDGCLRFLAHLYYCITGALRPSCISSSVQDLGYPTLISLTNLSTFPYGSLQRRNFLSIIFVIGLKNSWLEMPRFFYTLIVCVRPHINRDLLNNTVIPGISILKQRGTDLRNDTANFWHCDGIV